jgi:hypothetical protein
MPTGKTPIDLLEPITPEQAKMLLEDAELQESCRRDGVDLGLIVNNLLLPLDERWKQHRKFLEMALAFKAAGKMNNPR